MAPPCRIEPRYNIVKGHPVVFCVDLPLFLLLDMFDHLALQHMLLQPQQSVRGTEGGYM